MKMSFEDTPLGMVSAAKKVMEEKHQPFLNVKFGQN